MYFHLFNDHSNVFSVRTASGAPAGAPFTTMRGDLCWLVRVGVRVSVYRPLALFASCPVPGLGHTLSVHVVDVVHVSSTARSTGRRSWVRPIREGIVHCMAGLAGGSLVRPAGGAG